MQLADTTPGQRILVYICVDAKDPYLVVGPGPPGTILTIPATVVEKNGGGILLGWKQGEVFPTHTVGTAIITPTLQAQGFVKVIEYGGHCQCLLFSESPTTTLSEKNCKQCGKKNDIGISQCWWCTCPNPTS